MSEKEFKVIRKLANNIKGNVTAINYNLDEERSLFELIENCTELLNYASSIYYRKG